MTDVEQVVSFMEEEGVVRWDDEGHRQRFLDAVGGPSLDASHAFPHCEVCGAAVDDPEATEPCARLGVAPESDET